MQFRFLLAPPWHARFAPCAHVQAHAAHAYGRAHACDADLESTGSALMGFEASASITETYTNDKGKDKKAKITLAAKVGLYALKRPLSPTLNARAVGATLQRLGCRQGLRFPRRLKIYFARWMGSPCGSLRLQLGRGCTAPAPGWPQPALGARRALAPCANRRPFFRTAAALPTGSPALTSLPQSCAPPPLPERK
jgi:hypothetical protein